MATSVTRSALLLGGSLGLACGAVVSNPQVDGTSSTSSGPAPATTGSGTTAPVGTTGSTTTQPQGTSSSGPMQTSSTGGSESGGGFLEPTVTDTGNIASCDSYEQDCPEGEKCNPYASDGSNAWNALGCFPVAASPGQPGEACEALDSGTSGFDTCDVGSMCWAVEMETNLGYCVALCQGSVVLPTCEDPSTICLIANEAFLNLCLLSCNPDGDDCPPGESCYDLAEGSVCAPTAGPGPGAPGTSCEDIASCNTGSICVAAAAHGPGCDSQACCTELCELSDPICDNPNQECQQVFEEGMAPPGSEDVGACMIPM